MFLMFVQYMLIFVNCLKIDITSNAEEDQRQNLIYRGWPTVEERK